MFRNLACLLSNSEDDVVRGQAAQRGGCGLHNAAPFVLGPLQLCRQRSDIGAERQDGRPSSEAHICGADIVIPATADQMLRTLIGEGPCGGSPEFDAILGIRVDRLFISRRDARRCLVDGGVIGHEKRDATQSEVRGGEENRQGDWHGGGKASQSGELRSRFDGGENLFLAFSGNVVGVDSKSRKNSLHEQSYRDGVFQAHALQRRLEENAKAQKNDKTGGALPEIKIAKATSQEIEDGGDPRTLCDEGIGAGGHFAGGKVGIEECKDVEEDGNPQQDPPTKGSGSVPEHRRQPNGDAESNQERNQCPGTT